MGVWPKAVLLDFYGTVVEEIRLPVVEICRQIKAASHEGVYEMEVVARWAKIFMGLCSRSFGPDYQLQKTLEQRSLQEALDYFKIDLDSFALSRLLSEYRANPTLFPESREVLSGCGIPVCLLTNIDNSEIVRALEFTGLHFAFTVTSEDCRSYKPRPETFRKALSLLGLEPSETLHVGDSLQSDVRGAMELGIPVLWINRRKTMLPAGSLNPQFTFPDLSGLREVLERGQDAGRNKNSEVAE